MLVHVFYIYVLCSQYSWSGLWWHNHAGDLVHSIALPNRHCCPPSWWPQSWPKAQSMTQHTILVSRSLELKRISQWAWKLKWVNCSCIAASISTMEGLRRLLSNPANVTIKKLGSLIWFINQPDCLGQKSTATPRGRCQQGSNPLHNASRAVALPTWPTIPHYQIVYLCQRPAGSYWTIELMM